MLLKEYDLESEESKAGLDLISPLTETWFEIEKSIKQASDD